MLFGRCMSKREAKEMRKTGTLNDSQDSLVPVFDAPEYLVKRLMNMSRDKLKEYFRGIGVRSPQILMFFEVSPETEMVGPILQRNGLREYKIHPYTKMDIYDSLRL